MAKVVAITGQPNAVQGTVTGVSGGYGGGGPSLSYDFSPTMNWAGTTYVPAPTSCSDACSQLCFFWMDWLRFKAPGGHQIKYQNTCTCCCPWGAYHDDTPLGFLRKGTICDQSWKFIICSMCCCCLNCTCNDVTMVKVSDASDVASMQFLMRDGPCSRWCGSFLAVGAAMGAVCADCYHFCGDNNTIITSEKIWDMKKESEKTQVGALNTINIVECKACHICPSRTMTRLTIKLDGTAENMARADLIPTLMLLPMMQAGALNNPCSHCSVALLPQASGSCFDCGRFVTVKRSKFEDMLNMAEASGGTIEAYGGAPPAADSVFDQVDDSDFPTVYEWIDGRGKLVHHRVPKPDTSNPYVLAERMIDR